MRHIFVLSIVNWSDFESLFDFLNYFQNGPQRSQEHFVRHSNASFLCDKRWIKMREQQVSCFLPHSFACVIIILWLFLFLSLSFSFSSTSFFLFTFSSLHLPLRVELKSQTYVCVRIVTAHKRRKKKLPQTYWMSENEKEIIVEDVKRQKRETCLHFDLCFSFYFIFIHSLWAQ